MVQPGPAAPGPKLVTAETSRPAGVAVASSRSVPVQAPLFPAAEVPRTMTGGTSRPAVPMSPAPSQRRKAARAAQPSLFDTTYEGSRTLATSVEAAVYCDAEVARAAERSFACAIDLVWPLVGFALFLAGFYWVAGSIQLTTKTVPWFAALFVFRTLLYRAAFCFAEIDTPGTRAAGLRLLTFEGRIPGRRARIQRMLGGLVSVLSLGIGLAWGLLDEERLTWHDHISRTFPTVRE